ncbi:hypothetical protein HYC85_028724 [Camellia sinensis]|uniref:Uncharacterized protein n=1 Tax=Camellia sinensis TaxID=4442 RepID=A0A7J7FVZ1_CAMSI|nr:hypothetical protein HYC85_028724 [Camellia sinensis]
MVLEIQRVQSNIKPNSKGPSQSIIGVFSGQPMSHNNEQQKATPNESSISLSDFNGRIVTLFDVP